jgi:ABC-type sugar transport system ATPase subunit
LIKGEASRDRTGSIIRTSLGDFQVAANYQGPVTVLIRPDAAKLDGGEIFPIEGKVGEVSFRGSLTRAVIETGVNTLIFDLPSSTRLPEKGQPVRIYIEPDKALEVFAVDRGNPA